MRRAAEVHRTVRRHIRKVAVPGVRLFDMCEQLEDCVRKLIAANGLQARRPRLSAPALASGCLIIQSHCCAEGPPSIALASAQRSPDQ